MIEPAVRLQQEEIQRFLATGETTCFVSPEYFDSDADPFSDFVLHETAHIFHNCKRKHGGSSRSRTTGMAPRG